jgi:hypothetical protein
MTIQELIHAFGIGIDENANPIEFKYLIELLKQWTV